MAATKSWIAIPDGSHFSLANLPFGIISTVKNSDPRPAVAIGEYALDLAEFTSKGGFSQLPNFGSHASVFTGTSLNAFAALGRSTHREVRSYLQAIFAADTPYAALLKDNDILRQATLIPLEIVSTHIPLTIGDYTDFFAGRNHACNVGALFRGPANALNPNYDHLPVGYHGRASSVVVSGTPVRRPWGQVIENKTVEPNTPKFLPCHQLDIELELGMFVCRENELGSPVAVAQAAEYIFGYVLLNDWSARDIQQWEYVPLGPFNAKNFATSISAWVVLADALEPFRAPGLENPNELVSYLKQNRTDFAHNINLEVDLKTSEGLVTTITRTTSANVVWSWEQMVAHHTVAGCNLRPGDLFGSGTISGTDFGTHGSLLEQTQAGKLTVKLEGGEERKFIEDGDTIIIRGWAGDSGGGIVGFGECVGQILPAIQRE